MSTEKKIFSLGKLTKALENHFMDHFSKQLFWVTAEIVKLNSKSGHYYLELADTRNEQTTALCNATIWATQSRSIQQSLGEDFFTVLKPGNKALFAVKIEYHSIYGLKLNILDIDPSYTYGDIERRKKETIEKLKREGLFDLQKTLHFTVLSKRIALIGSPNTSGFRDFKEELFNNESYRNFKVKEFKTSVQGDTAKNEIVKALKDARKYDVDVIVIIRGGGSKMDLDIFNDYEIAKTICETKTPVLTGIGHESDEVVADLVAHQKFITPTAVGKYIWVRIREFRFFISQNYDQIIKKSLDLLSGAKDEFYHKNKYLIHHTKELLQEWKDIFNTLTHTINKKSQWFIHEEKEEMTSLSYQLQKGLNAVIHNEQYLLEQFLNNVKFKALTISDHQREAVLENLTQKVAGLSFNQIDTERIKLKNSEDLLAILNPEKILNSGYTITTLDNIDIHKIELHLGQEIKTLSSKAIITSKITNIETLKNG